MVQSVLCLTNHLQVANLLLVKPVYMLWLFANRDFTCRDAKEAATECTRHVNCCLAKFIAALDTIRGVLVVTMQMPWQDVLR